MYLDLLKATGDTLYMVFLGTFFATIIGLPIGTFLFTTKYLNPHPRLNKILSSIINLTRSIPFLIFLVILIPFTRLIIGTSIGLNAALVPLTLAAVPFFARLTADFYQNLPKGLIDAGHAMGANNYQMILFILLPEARPALIRAITLTAITLVNYSAMAGTVGGGGLGDFAIRYGYQRFDGILMTETLIILIIIVQTIQYVGDKISNYFSKGTIT